MTDYTELKRAAEAAPSGPWVAENDSLYFKDDGYTRHLMDADAGHDVEDEAYYSALKFIAAANPAAVLALIAENEELGRYLCTCRDCGGEGALHTGDWHSYGHMEPPEPVMEKCGECDGTGLIGEIQDLHQVITERDKLKAENEALRRERDARHPFKPFHEPAIGFTGCVICGVYTDHGGLPCPKTRATADAAMGKGEQS